MSTFLQVSAQDVISAVEQDSKEGLQTKLVDVRNIDVHAKGNIPGSVNLPYGTLEDYIDDLNKCDKVYVYCNRGGKSLMAINKLLKLGVTSNLVNVLGGYSEFIK